MNEYLTDLEIDIDNHRMALNEALNTALLPSTGPPSPSPCCAATRSTTSNSPKEQQVRHRQLHHRQPGNTRAAYTIAHDISERS